VLAGALRYLTGDQLLLRGETWAVHQYAFYLAFRTVSGRPPGEGWTPPIGMLPDQLECALHHAHRPVRMPEQFRIDDPPVRRSPNGSGA